MLETFRNALKSKIGAGIALIVLILIALAFASGDVASTGGFGGVAGGDRVATIPAAARSVVSMSSCAPISLFTVPGLIPPG